MKKIISLVLGFMLFATGGYANNNSLKLGFEAGLVIAYVTDVILELATSDELAVSTPCSEIAPFPGDAEDVDCSHFVNEFKGQVSCDEVKDIIKRVSGMRCYVEQTDDTITVSFPDISEDLNKVLPVFTINQEALTYDDGVFVLNLSKLGEF